MLSQFLLALGLAASGLALGPTEADVLKPLAQKWTASVQVAARAHVPRSELVSLVRAMRREIRGETDAPPDVLLAADEAADAEEQELHTADPEDEPDADNAPHMLPLPSGGVGDVDEPAEADEDADPLGLMAEDLYQTLGEVLESLLAGSEGGSDEALARLASLLRELMDDIDEANGQAADEPAELEPAAPGAEAGGSEAAGGDVDAEGEGEGGEEEEAEEGGGMEEEGGEEEEGGAEGSAPLAEGASAPSPLHQAPHPAKAQAQEEAEFAQLRLPPTGSPEPEVEAAEAAAAVARAEGGAGGGGGGADAEEEEAERAEGAAAAGEEDDEEGSGVLIESAPGSVFDQGASVGRAPDDVEAREAQEAAKAEEDADAQAEEAEEAQGAAEGGGAALLPQLRARPATASEGARSAPLLAAAALAAIALLPAAALARAARRRAAAPTSDGRYTAVAPAHGRVAPLTSRLARLARRGERAEPEAREAMLSADAAERLAAV